MKKVIMLAIMLLSTSNFLYAKQCQIENLVATQLNLNASYLSQAATSFSVACDSNYAIKYFTNTD